MGISIIHESTAGTKRQKHSHGWSYGQLAMGYWWLAIGYERLVIGDWWLAIGDWLLNIGYWWLAIEYGRHCRYPCPYTLRFTSTPYTLRFTLLAPAPLSLASNLSPYRLIAHCLPEAVFWRRCHWQMQWAVRSSAGQNRWSIRQNIINSTVGR